MASYYSITAGTRHTTLKAATAAERRALKAEGGGSGGVDKATKAGRAFYRTVTYREPIKYNTGRKMTKTQRRVNASKKSKQRRMAKALQKFLKAQNPAAKYAGAKIQRNKGSITIIPMKLPRRASR